MSELESSKDVSHDRKLICQVVFDTGENIFSGTSTHFNEKGMLVMCRNPAPLNSKGKLRLSFPGLKNPVELIAEVVWTNIHGSGDSLSPRGMGIKFSNVERETERLLAELSGQYESLVSIYSCYYS